MQITFSLCFLQLTFCLFASTILRGDAMETKQDMVVGQIEYDELLNELRLK